MKSKVVHQKIEDVKSNPNNPRTIKDSKFKKLVASIKEMPEMLDMRPIMVDENNVVIGGNMRLKACRELKHKKVATIVYTREIHGQSYICNVLKKNYEEAIESLVIKDNVSFGDWDWDMLANEWNNKQLDEWGMDVWQPEDEIDYSILDDVDADNAIDGMRDGIKRAVMIEFDSEDYEEAYELVKVLRHTGNLGKQILSVLRNIKTDNV